MSPGVLSSASADRSRLRSLVLALTLSGAPIAAGCGAPEPEELPADAAPADTAPDSLMVHSRLPASRGVRGAIHTREAVEARAAALDSLAAADR